MLSIDYKLSVPKFPAKEIGYGALVRAYDADLRIEVTNDGRKSLHKINVAPVLESYVGQEKPILFLRVDKQVIDELPPKATVPKTFSIFANYPGLIAVAIHITDAAGNVVKAKRQMEMTYRESPVRWWF